MKWMRERKQKFDKSVSIGVEEKKICNTHWKNTQELKFVTKSHKILI